MWGKKRDEAKSIELTYQSDREMDVQSFQNLPETKLLVTSIDEAISIFPQKVISQLVTSYLFPDFTFDCTFITCDREKVNLNQSTSISQKEAVVTQYSTDWIHIALTPQFTGGNFKFCFEGKGVGYILLMLVKKASFHPYQSIQFAALNAGKYIIISYPSTNKIKIFCVAKEEGKQEEITHVYVINCPEGVLQIMDTILFGIGFIPQSITLLPYPPLSDPILTNIDKFSAEEEIIYYDTRLSQPICNTCYHRMKG